jgi:hypothetical protein
MGEALNPKAGRLSALDEIDLRTLFLILWIW